jgi:hypothetical protein
MEKSSHNSQSGGKSLYNIDGVTSNAPNIGSTLADFLNSIQQPTVQKQGSSSGGTLTDNVVASTITSAVLNILQTFLFAQGKFQMRYNSQSISPPINLDSNEYVFMYTDTNVSLFFHTPYTYTPDTNIGSSSITTSGRMGSSDYTDKYAANTWNEHYFKIYTSKFRVSGPWTFIESDKVSFASNVITLNYLDRYQVVTPTSSILLVDTKDRGIDFEYTVEGSTFAANPVMKLGFFGYSRNRDRWVFYKDAKYNGQVELPYTNYVRTADTINSFDLDTIYTNRIQNADHTGISTMDIYCTDELTLSVLDTHGYTINVDGPISERSSIFNGTYGTSASIITPLYNIGTSSSFITNLNFYSSAESHNVTNGITEYANTFYANYASSYSLYASSVTIGSSSSYVTTINTYGTNTNTYGTSQKITFISDSIETIPSFTGTYNTLYQLYANTLAQFGSSVSYIPTYKLYATTQTTYGTTIKLYATSLLQFGTSGDIIPTITTYATNVNMGISGTSITNYNIYTATTSDITTSFTGTYSTLYQLNANTLAQFGSSASYIPVMNTYAINHGGNYVTSNISSTTEITEVTPTFTGTYSTLFQLNANTLAQFGSSASYIPTVTTYALTHNIYAVTQNITSSTSIAEVTPTFTGTYETLYQLYATTLAQFGTSINKIPTFTTFSTSYNIGSSGAYTTNYNNYSTNLTNNSSEYLTYATGRARFGTSTSIIPLFYTYATTYQIYAYTLAQFGDSGNVIPTFTIYATNKNETINSYTGNITTYQIYSSSVQYGDDSVKIPTFNTYATSKTDAITTYVGTFDTSYYLYSPNVQYGDNTNFIALVDLYVTTYNDNINTYTANILTKYQIFTPLLLFGSSANRIGTYTSYASIQTIDASTSVTELTPLFSGTYDTSYSVFSPLINFGTSVTNIGKFNVMSNDLIQLISGLSGTDAINVIGDGNVKISSGGVMSIQSTDNTSGICIGTATSVPIVVGTTNTPLTLKEYCVFGSTPSYNYTAYFDRNFAGISQIQLEGSITDIIGNNAYGIYVKPSFVNTQSTSILASERIDPPTITNGGGTVGLTTSLYITDASTYGLNNYALYVNNGIVHFNGSDSSKYFEWTPLTNTLLLNNSSLELSYLSTKTLTINSGEGMPTETVQNKINLTTSKKYVMFSSGTNVTEMFLDGSSLRIQLSDNTNNMLSGLITGCQSNGVGCSYQFNAHITMIGGNINIKNFTINTVTCDNGWFDCDITTISENGKMYYQLICTNNNAVPTATQWYSDFTLIEMIL